MPPLACGRTLPTTAELFPCTAAAVPTPAGPTIPEADKSVSAPPFPFAVPFPFARRSHSLWLLSYSGDAAINPPSTAAAALGDRRSLPTHVERWGHLRPPGALPAGWSSRPPPPPGGSPVRGEVSLQPSCSTHSRQRRRARVKDSPLRGAPCPIPRRQSPPSSSTPPDSLGDSVLW